MPRYTYCCAKCEEVFEAVHSIKEKLDICEECQGELVRVPSQTFIRMGHKTADAQHKIGDLVKQHIEESKKELRTEQNKLKSEEYK